MNLTDLSTFAFVADEGTITGAATRLGVPKSTVSRRVARLEDALGVELLRRSARSVSLTDHGRALHQRTAAALREITDAATALVDADPEPSGTLRLTTAADFGQTTRFADLIASFGMKYPRVVVEVVLTNRIVDLVEEGFDIGVRMHGPNLPGGATLMSRTLRRFEARLYAGRGYAETHGLPKTPEELADHRFASHSSFAQGPLGMWSVSGVVGKELSLPEPRWLVNDFGALQSLAVVGAGIVVLSTLLAEPMIESGELVPVLPEYRVPGGATTLVWPASRHMAPRVRAFIDHAAAVLGG